MTGGSDDELRHTRFVLRNLKCGQKVTCFPFTVLLYFIHSETIVLYCLPVPFVLSSGIRSCHAVFGCRLSCSALSPSFRLPLRFQWLFPVKCFHSRLIGFVGRSVRRHVTPICRFRVFSASLLGIIPSSILGVGLLATSVGSAYSEDVYPTSDRRLVYEGIDASVSIAGYTDADWAGDVND